MTETADPHSITPYSVSIDNGPRHLVLGLSVRLKLGGCNLRSFRLHFCTLGELWASEVLPEISLGFVFTWG
jgi:hypothetical protein